MSEPKSRTPSKATIDTNRYRRIRVLKDRIDHLEAGAQSAVEKYKGKILNAQGELQRLAVDHHESTNEKIDCSNHLRAFNDPAPIFAAPEPKE